MEKESLDNIQSDINSTLDIQRERVKFVDKIFNMKAFQLEDLFTFQTRLINVSLNTKGEFLKRVTDYIGTDLSTSFIIFIVNYGVCRTLNSISNYGFYDVLPKEGNRDNLIAWAEQSNSLRSYGRIGDICTDGKDIGFILGSDGKDKFIITTVGADPYVIDKKIIEKKFFKPLKFIDLHLLYDTLLTDAKNAFRNLFLNNE